METPAMHHMTKLDYEHVYEPAEDTFLMMDALEKDLANISISHPLVIVEVCSGTGIVSASLSNALGNSSAFFITVDINHHACKASNRTMKLNGAQTFQVIQADLLSCLNSGTVDILICNPPYVPTTEEELHSTNALTHSWAGGKNGRQVMDRLFTDVARLLCPGGKFYLLVLEENLPSEIIKIFHNHGFDSIVIISRKAGRERLSVIKFVKK